jgi:hypothetical protein
MFMAIKRTLSASALLALLASCASSPPDGDAPATAREAPAATNDSPQPDEGYVLSAQELKLSCRKLTGRMQVRILQIRDYEQRTKPSASSRLAQQAATSLHGGSRRGIDPDAEYRRDRAILEAYNQRLAAKKCKIFDLEFELKPKSPRETPTPTKRQSGIGRSSSFRRA